MAHVWVYTSTTQSCVFCASSRFYICFFCCCYSPLQLTEGKSSSQFPSTAVVRMKPRWDPHVREPLIRGLTALFHRRFFTDSLVPLGSPLVGWSQRLIAAIYSSSKEGFTLFGVTTKQAIVPKPCHISCRQRWLACCPTLLMSPDLSLWRICWLFLIFFVLYEYYIILIVLTV